MELGWVERVRMNWSGYDTLVGMGWVARLSYEIARIYILKVYGEDNITNLPTTRKSFSSDSDQFSAEAEAWRILGRFSTSQKNNRSRFAGVGLSRPLSRRFKTPLVDVSITR